MNTHQGYNTSEERGAQCSNCEEWIPHGDNCVLMLPATVDERGAANTNTTAIHGVVCMGCFESA